MISQRKRLRFFPGCRLSRQRSFRQTRERAIDLLSFVGADVTAMPADECICSGYPLLALNRRAFEEHARRLRSQGDGPDVSSCPLCCFALGSAGRESTFHTVQLLAERIDRLRELPLRSSPVTVTYHDPCYLARGLGVTEEPRLVLSSLPGVTLVEMGRNRRDTFCCGMGGAVEHVVPEMVSLVARERMEEAQRTGATVCVTCCPPCVEALAPVGLEVSIDVLDIADFLYSRVELG